MNKKISKVLIILAVLGLFLFGVYSGIKSMRHHKAQTDSKSARKTGSPLPVKTLKVDYGLINEHIGAECLVKESALFNINTDIEGQIIKFNADVGDTVTAGQVLIEYDRAYYKSMLSASKDMLSEMKKQLAVIEPYVNKFQRELKRNNSAISYVEFLKLSKEVREIKFQIAKTRAEIVTRKKNLRSTIIKARFSGVVIENVVNSGIYMQAYEKLMTIAKIDPVFMECDISEDKLQSIFNKQISEISFSAYPGRTFKGEVVNIKPVVDEKKRTIQVVIKLNNDDKTIMLGSHGIVHLLNNKKVLRVPSPTLLNVNGNSANIFIVDKDNVAHLKKIRIGAFADGYMEVKKGLSETDEVVIVGQIALKDKDVVEKHN
jgi:RND family efflux transporter MFP subunit